MSDDCPCCAARRQAEQAAKNANARVRDLEASAEQMRSEIASLRVGHEDFVWAAVDLERNRDRARRWAVAWKQRANELRDKAQALQDRLDVAERHAAELSHALAVAEDQAVSNQS